MRWVKIIVYSVFLLLSFGAGAQDILPKPNPPRLVNDAAGVLSAEQVARLEAKLVAYDDSTSSQVVVVLIQSLKDYPIEEYATKLYRDWGIGNKKTNNGVLLLAAIADHKIRIEVGYGLEGAIPDITANQIIRNDIGPSFRAGEYFEGLDKATNSIIQAATGEYKAPEGYRDSKGGDGGKLLGMLVVFIIIILVLANINRKGGGGGGFMSRRGYRGVGPTIFWPGGSGGWTGGGGGGGWSGGGGFGGFGGGSSGGGGASGGW